MDKNPYDDTSISWLPQPPIDRNRSTYVSPPQHTRMRAQTSPKAASTKQIRMPKQKAMEVASFLKKGIAVTSVLSFGMFAWLAGGHTVGTSTSKTTSSGNSHVVTTPSPTSSATSTPSPTSSATSTPSPASNSTSTQSNGGFFNQGGGSSVGSSSSSSAVSGTSVS